jgi:hypothetical protein
MKLFLLWRVTPTQQTYGAGRGMAKSNNSKGNEVHLVDTAFDPVSAALKQMHEAVASEALPDEFLRILDEIDAKIAAAKAPPKIGQ